MKAGVKDFFGALSAVLCAMALLSSLTAVATGSREMYLQTVVYALIGAGVALAMLLRM